MRGTYASPKVGQFIVAPLLAGALLISPVAWGTSSPFASKQMETLDADGANRITRLLRDQIQRAIVTQKSPRETLRNVTISTKDSVVTIDLSRSYLPGGISYMGSELEDKLSNIQNVVLGVMENELGYSVSQVLFLFDGRPLEFYYPNDFSTSTPSAKAIGSIVVSAGHGVYLHHGSTPDWRFQRDVHHGVLEDQITQPLASELGALLVSRSGSTTTFVRSFGNTVHAPSGYTWNDLSARYFLAEANPLRTDIWNTLPTSTAALRERDEDIRARPLYANDLNAAALISIHTNGDDTGTARGTRIYHHPGRAGDAALASSMLCYMREIIQAQPGYEEFPVAPSPHAQSGHGENSLAQVPAVIVETAFHSNASDAAALLDPVFRMAAMKGVEKGYRLNQQNEPCTPYAITDIPDISVPWGAAPYIEIYFEGFPQYPVELTVENLSCGAVCTPGSGVINSDYPSPVLMTFTCDGDPDSPPAAADWRVRLKDADGVETKFDYNTRCGGGFAKHVPRAEGTPTPLRTSMSATK